MTFIIFEELQQYHIAQITETHKNNWIVECANNFGKRKVKTEQKLLELTECKSLNDFYQNVSNKSVEIDLELIVDLFENSSTFKYDEIATIFYDDKPSELAKISTLFALNTNIKFQNLGKGIFRKSTSDEITKRQQELDQKIKEQTLLNDYTTSLRNKQIPENWQNLDIIKLINKTDKNNLEQKALNTVAKELSTTPLELCVEIGLIADIATYFINSFVRDNLSDINKITSHKILDINDLEHNEALQVFSIDDSYTTEIDDAFSVTKVDNKHIIGVHIAAPALDSSIVDLAVENISTIYYPANKITMLPDSIVSQYTLQQGKTVPSVSIYFIVNDELAIEEYYSKLELITVKANLRIEKLEEYFNQDNLNTNHNYPFESELKLLYQFARKLEEKRGRPSVNQLIPDYIFNIDNGKINIKPRIRGNPIDIVVSELMILANCSWGRMLTNAFIPAIYRVKQPNSPVKMTTSPDSHVGLNVDYYTWATSPLRRSVDYINQYQIISLIRKDKKHYTTISYELACVVENFDTKYNQYIAFQDKMERYWSLKYLIQEGKTELIGIFAYKSKIHLSGIPINIESQGIIKQKDQGQEVKVLISNINLINLTFDFKIIDN